MLLIKFQNLKSPFVTLPIIQEQIQQLFVLLHQNSQFDVISLVNQVGASHNHLATHISGNFFFFFPLDIIRNHSQRSIFFSS
jgi:hypothetical protein